MGERDTSGSDASTRRAAILAAATRVFLDEGFHAATIKRIADEAGCSPGLVYWYFADKRELFSAVVRASVERVVPGLEALPTDATPEEVLVHVVAAVLTYSRDLGLPRFGMLADVLSDPELRAVWWESGLGAILVAIAGYLAALSQSGFIPTVDLELATELLLSMIVGQLVIDGLVPSRPPRPARLLAERVVALFLAGLRAGTLPPTT